MTGGPVRIRRSDVVDAPLLAELFEGMRAEKDRPTGDDDFTDALAEWMTLDGARHLTWIAERDGRPFGMIWLQIVPRVPRPHLRDRFSGDLQTFWVRPDERGNGIGTLLLEALFAEADRRGLERVVLHSSPGALPLYERTGFAHDGLIVSRPLPRP